MTAFVLIASVTSWLLIDRPIVAYFYTADACNAALNAQAVVHGNRFTGACFATGMKP